MTGLSMGMIVESLVALLLLLTIGYCVTLNRRLQRLRADEEMLRATISELITATEIAERAILGLKATANECEKTITTRLAEGWHVSSQLSEQIAAGDAVFHRIALLTQAAGARPAAAPEASSTQRVTKQPAVIEAPQSPQPMLEITRSGRLLSAVEESTARVQNLRRMTGDRAA